MLPSHIYTYMPKQKEDPDKSFVALRMEDTLIYRLDKIAEEKGSNRSKIMIEAAEYYTKAIECIRCGALNPYNGVECSVCGASIYSEEEIAARGDKGLNQERWQNILLKTFEDGDDYSKYLIKKFLNEGYTPIYSFSHDKNEKGRKYKIRLTFMKNDINVSPAEQNLTVDLSAEFLYNFLKEMGKEPYSPVSNIIMNKMRMSELRQELMPSNEEEKPNHVKEVRKNGKED